MTSSVFISAQALLTTLSEMVDVVTYLLLAVVVEDVVLKVAVLVEVLAILTWECLLACFCLDYCIIFVWLTWYHEDVLMKN